MGFFGKIKKRTIMTESNNYYKNKEKLGPYLAGLIEGNGTIIVYNEHTKVKNSPIIEIVFHKKDLGLAIYLENLLKIGKIICSGSEDNNILWRISKIEDVYKLINLVNGYFRTPKYEGLVKAINWINEYITFNQNKTFNEANKLELLNKEKIELILRNINNLPILDLDWSDIESNGWLAGLTDADGNFEILLSMNSKKHKPRVNLSYKLEIRQNNIQVNNINLNNNYYEIMIKICSLFNCKLYSREKKLKLKGQENIKIYRSYIVSINDKLNLLKVRDYFNEYPLLSSKYLDYKDWESVLTLINEKKSFTDISILDKSKKIITNFNKTRVNPTWDHLNNNNYVS